MVVHSVGLNALSLLESLIIESPGMPVKAVIEVEQRIPHPAREEIQRFASKNGWLIEPHEKICGSDPHFIVTPYLQVRTRDQKVNGVERRLTGTIKVPLLESYDGIGSPPLFELTFALSHQEYFRFASLPVLTYVDVERAGEMLTKATSVPLEISYDFVKNCEINDWTEVSLDIPVSYISSRRDVAARDIIGKVDQAGRTGDIERLMYGFSGQIKEADRLVKGFLVRDLGFDRRELSDVTYAQIQVSRNEYGSS